MMTGLSKKINIYRNFAHRFFRMVASRNQTYYPHLERKNRLQVIRDNLLWVMKHRELNEYYYIYGLDRKGKRLEQDVLSYRDFVRIRDSRNLKPAGASFNYAALLQDKFVFGQFLTSLKFPNPRNIALLNKRSVTWLQTMEEQPLSDLTTSQHVIDGFCKKLSGMHGKGAFRLTMTDGKLYLSEKASSLQDLVSRIEGTYLLQERVMQHKVLDDLFPGALNTMRVVTFNNNGHIEVFNAAMKIGTGKSNVDNWGYGGIAVGIDLDTGRLRKSGFYKPNYGRLVEVHPDTNVRLQDVTVPYFKESLDMLCNVHRYLYGVHSIGWDIAVGPDGPVVIEGNEDWDGSFAMAAEPDFRNRFMKMFSFR